MECVDRALKSSFRPEFLIKTAHPQGLLDDFWPINGQTGGGCGDDFFVDGLLDFSKDHDFVEKDDKEEGVNPVAQTENEKIVIPTVAAVNFCVKDGSVSVPESELCVPADDLADLEWLSHFVDDSSPGYSLTYPAGKLPEKPLEKKPAPPLIPVPENPSFTTPVQTKARSKRARTGGRVWSLGSPSLTESSTSSSSSSSCTSNPWLIYNDFSQTAESIFGKPPLKKPKKKKLAAEIGGGGGGGSQQPRRCSHCLVQKTPQWRTGPLGAKTLCNACGVRYKSGRLLPEYRPACSPTFSSEVHSNNHRKVLEMRRKKEVETGLDHPVQSF